MKLLDAYVTTSFLNQQTMWYWMQTIIPTNPIG